jgi:hypothetical protein
MKVVGFWWCKHTNHRKQIKVFSIVNQIVTVIHGKKISKSLRINIQVCIFDHRLTH